jgi:hypothetical protein
MPKVGCRLLSGRCRSAQSDARWSLIEMTTNGEVALRLDAVGQQVEGLFARSGKVHDVGAITGLAAKALAEELGDIELVVYHEDADAHPDPPMC